MKFKKQVILALLFISFIALVTCHKNPTEPKTGTLTGTVLLEGQTNHSGVTVVYPVRYVTKIMNNMKKIQYSIYRIMIGNGKLSNGAGKLASPR